MQEQLYCLLHRYLHSCLCNSNVSKWTLCFCHMLHDIFGSWHCYYDITKWNRFCFHWGKYRCSFSWKCQYFTDIYNRRLYVCGRLLVNYIIPHLVPLILLYLHRHYKHDVYNSVLQCFLSRWSTVMCNLTCPNDVSYGKQALYN